MSSYIAHVFWLLNVYLASIILCIVQGQRQSDLSYQTCEKSDGRFKINGHPSILALPFSRP